MGFTKVDVKRILNMHFDLLRENEKYKEGYRYVLAVAEAAGIKHE